MKRQTTKTLLYLMMIALLSTPGFAGRKEVGGPAYEPATARSTSSHRTW